jgi:hypothetical protein
MGGAYVFRDIGIIAPLSNSLNVLHIGKRSVARYSIRCPVPV